MKWWSRVTWMMNDAKQKRNDQELLSVAVENSSALIHHVLISSLPFILSLSTWPAVLFQSTQWRWYGRASPPSAKSSQKKSHDWSATVYKKSLLYSIQDFFFPPLGRIRNQSRVGSFLFFCWEEEEKRSVIYQLNLSHAGGQPLDCIWKLWSSLATFSTTQSSGFGPSWNEVARVG